MPADLKVIGGLFLEQARDLLPYFLAGAVFAAFIKTFRWDRRIRASLVRHEKMSVLVAVAAGLVSPLCSCGILPVVISLSAAGVPLPPVLALLITSPLMSPDALVITAGQLGWSYALWKLLAAAAVGLCAGFAAHGLSRVGFLSGTALRTERLLGEDGCVRPGFEEIAAAGCFRHASPGAPRGDGDAAVPERRAKRRLGVLAGLLFGGPVVPRESRILFFLERLRDMVWLVGKFLALALAIQAAVTYYVPVNAIEPLLGRRSALSVLFAALIAIPLPLHQVVAPSVVKGLLAAGMSPGAGMAMLIGGPVTSIPAMAALLGIYERRAFYLYVAVGATAAVAAGCLFQLLHG